MTSQAKRVSDALTALGLRRGTWRTDADFSVRTETFSRRDKASGLRYTEFGDAMAHPQRKALATIEANADHLAAQGLGVTLVYIEDRLVTALVHSRYNPRCEVSILRDGVWSRRAAAAA